MIEDDIFYIEQKSYNSKKAKQNKNLYFLCNTTILTCSLITIPIIATQNLPILIPILSASMTALAQGLSSLFKFHEKWIYHRNIAELLKSENRKYKKDLFNYKSLNDVEKQTHYLETIESIVENGNSQWKNIIQKHQSIINNLND